MKLLRDPRSRWLAALIAAGLLLGIGGGTFAAFSATTSNGGNSFGVKADYEPPTIVRSEIARTTATTGGKIRSSAPYYVYAQVTDGGNPASGVNSVTANVCNITTASCAAVALTSGNYTVSGLTYDYRSGSTTANAGLTNGSKTYTVTAVDAASNSSGAVSFSVTVDGNAPSGSNVQTANASGGTAGKAETGDTITFTFSEGMDPASIANNWDGTATTVVAAFANGGCGASDAVSVTSVNLGTLCLSGDYVNGSKTFTGSTMVLSGGGTIVTITLGTPPANGLNTETVAGVMVWTPVAAATDVAGNACATTVANEVTPPIDVEF
jgi:chitinase